MPRFQRADGRRHGPPKVLLTPEQLAAITKFASQGKRDAGIAAGLGISVRLYRELKAERQPQEIGEAVERGRELLHDSALAVKARLMLDPAVDDRVRSEAASWILHAVFGYRDRTPLQIGVGVNVGGDATAPQLTIIQEQLAPSAEKAMLAALESTADPMTLDGEAIDADTEQPQVARSPRRRLNPYPLIHAAPESALGLEAAWGEASEPPTSTTVHVTSASLTPEIERG